MRAPILTYLTVFRSRLGSAHLVLDLTDFRHQSYPALLRKTSGLLDEREDLALSDSANERVFSYLVEKSLLGTRSRKQGRYRGLSLKREGSAWKAVGRRGEELPSIPVYLLDVALSDPKIGSTIGTPTPENASEAVDFALQLRLLSKAKNTWTARAQMISALRDRSTSETGDNPFLLGLERIALLSQVIAVDGAALREVLRTVAEDGRSKISRDDVADEFVGIVDRAAGAVKELHLPPPEAREIREFRASIRETVRKKGTRRSSADGKRDSSGPGVLEHRVAPRLEWLVDLGYLNKDGLPRNGFTYRIGSEVGELVAVLDRYFGGDDWADEVAFEVWHHHAAWREVRSGVDTLERSEAVRTAYRMMKRRIGPSPLGEVAFISGLLWEGAQSYRQSVDAVVEFAQETEGASLSGGRYRRAPENIYVPDAALAG